MDKREYWIDLLRIFAILGVIMIHVTFGGTCIDAVEYHKIWALHMFLDTASKFAVPIFIMISGCLFLNKDITIKRMIAKAVKLIAIFFLVSIFYAVYDNVTLAHLSLVNIDETTKDKILAFVFTGAYHLWFLPMLAGMYLVTPVLKSIIKNDDKKAMLKYCLILWFILNTISSFSFLFTDNTKWYYSAFIFYSNFRIPLAGNYIGYYVLGYYLSTLNIKKIPQMYIYLIGILSISTALILTNELPYTNYNIYALSGETSTLVIIYSASLFIFFKEIIGKISFNKIVCKIIPVISNSVLLMYLSHVYFIESINQKIGTTLMYVDNTSSLYILNTSIHQIFSIYTKTTLYTFILSVVITIFIKVFKNICHKIKCSTLMSLVNKRKLSRDVISLTRRA